MLYLIRHAKAGSRSHWVGDDRERPLSKRGWRQAAAIADALVPLGLTHLVSSPYVRCRQTLEPIASALDLDIALDERLAEEQRFEDVLELLAEVPDGTALCSHGDMIPATMHALERRRCTFGTPPDWRKGTVWYLQRTASGDIVHARVTPPPE
jgi:8-oxo-dGTP diphosphatase